MSFNRYAPPNAEVGDVVSHDAAPPLWNPGAAAAWSLLLSPAFGAFLHMKNWQALGETEKAATSKIWIIVSIVVILCVTLASALLPDSKLFDNLSRVISLVVLLSWYYSIGKSQVAVVRSRFGKTYPRRGWAKPLLLAFVAIVIFVAVVVAMFIVSDTSAA